MIKDEPEWDALPGDTPLVRDLLRRCLQKDPSFRLRDIGDARIEIAESITQPREVVAGSRRFPLWWLVASATVMLAAVILIGLVEIGYFKPIASPQVVTSRDGKQLFYRWEDRVWVVDIRFDYGFSPGKPRLLFEQPGFSHRHPIRGWDLSLDGRFLMVKYEEIKPQPVTELILVLNWFEDLKRLAPTGR